MQVTVITGNIVVEYTQTLYDGRVLRWSTLEQGINHLANLSFDYASMECNHYSMRALLHAYEDWDHVYQTVSGMLCYQKHAVCYDLYKYQLTQLRP